MKQARLVEPEKVILEEVERPEPGEGQVLIRVKRIGICGSDIHALLRQASIHYLSDRPGS